MQALVEAGESESEMYDYYPEDEFDATTSYKADGYVNLKHWLFQNDSKTAYEEALKEGLKRSGVHIPIEVLTGGKFFIAVIGKFWHKTDFYWHCKNYVITDVT